MSILHTYIYMNLFMSLFFFFVSFFFVSLFFVSFLSLFLFFFFTKQQQHSGGDGVGAPIQLLVGGDARFMAAPSIHQPTPSQRQAAAAELDKNHGVTLTEFIEFLCHIADAACGRQKWEVSSNNFKPTKQNKNKNKNKKKNLFFFIFLDHDVFF